MSPSCTCALFQAPRSLTAAERREVDARLGRLAAAISGRRPGPQPRWRARNISEAEMASLVVSGGLEPSTSRM